MDLLDLLHGLKARAPWLSAGRPILLRCGFTIHRGYDLTIKGALTEGPDPIRTAKLETALKEHAVSGEKLVRVVKVSASERRLLAGWIDSKRKSVNALTDAFPGVAANSEVRISKDVAPASVGSLKLEVGSAAVFTAARSYLDRVQIPASQLKASAGEGYEKIYGIQRLYVQTYDAIWLPPSGDYVYIATDLPLGVPSGFARDSQLALEAHLRKALGRPIVAENLWPAVEGLYQAKDGKLIDYGFVNNAEAVKHHTGRKGGKSLWEDIYDKAGADAVGDDLLLFKIAVAWARAEGGSVSAKAQPEVLLPGRAIMLQQANAKLDHAIIRNCLTTRDLDFVVSKVLPHLP